MYREDDLLKGRLVQIEKGWPMCGDNGPSYTENGPYKERSMYREDYPERIVHA